MIGAVRMILGEVWSKRVELVVDDDDFGLWGEHRLTPHTRKLLDLYHEDVCEYLVRIHNSHQELIRQIAPDERPDLGPYWWRFIVDPEPLPTQAPIPVVNENGPVRGDRS